jgi:GNAT superfamily N-acetyltransferase
MSPKDLTIRPLGAADENVWRTLWTGYLDYYQTKLPEAVFASTFARLLSGKREEPHGLLALVDGKAVGLTHYILHRSCWKVEEVCYLQDLYTSPESRGHGVARALIGAVYAAADAAGAPGVYWLTQEFNYRGRMLYDQVGTKSPFIRYNRPV